MMLSLSFSNMCFCLFILLDASNTFFQFNWSDFGNIVIVELSNYGLNSSAWLTSSLCFFYFIKIVQFRWRILFLLKEKIDVLIPRIILLVELGSLGNGFIKIMENLFSQITSTGLDLSSFNTTEMYSQNSQLDIFRYVNTFGSLVMAILFIAGILVSLKLHLHNMSKTLGSSANANGKSQRAVQTMTYLLVFYIFIFVMSILREFPQIQSWLVVILYETAKFSYSPFQSLLLILGNPRYKNILCNSICFCHRMCVQRG